MLITRQQFQALAPAASPATVDALFAAAGTGNLTVIDSILLNHGLDEPAALAQFIAACHLASVGFTDFNHPFYGLSPADWLSQRARQWTDARLHLSADEWDWQHIAWNAAWLFDMPSLPWLVVNDTLATVCAALEIEDRSEEFADGYDMQ